MAGIFICYRRDDSAGWAGRLCADLKARLDGTPVFMDVDAIPPGVPFDTYIAQAVGSCHVLIALIGPRWVSAADKTGRRRLEDERDFTRIEIATALKRNIRVIPALVGGAAVPAAEDLPGELKPLALRQCYELDDHGWDADCERLARALRPVVEQKRRVVARALGRFALAALLILSGYGLRVFQDQGAERMRAAAMDWNGAWRQRLTHHLERLRVRPAEPAPKTSAQPAGEAADGRR